MLPWQQPITPAGLCVCVGALKNLFSVTSVINSPFSIFIGKFSVQVVMEILNLKRQVSTVVIFDASVSRRSAIIPLVG